MDWSVCGHYLDKKRGDERRKNEENEENEGNEGKGNVQV